MYLQLPATGEVKDCDGDAPRQALLDKKEAKTREQYHIPKPFEDDLVLEVFSQVPIYPTKDYVPKEHERDADFPNNRKFWSEGSSEKRKLDFFADLLRTKPRGDLPGAWPDYITPERCLGWYK